MTPTCPTQSAGSELAVPPRALLATEPQASNQRQLSPLWVSTSVGPGQ